MSRDLSLLTPDFRKKVELRLKANPEIFVTDAFRTLEQQKELYAMGRTKPGQIVTWTLDSEHTKGLAVDVGFRGKELYPTDIKKRRKIADSASTYGIQRGYDLWKKDKPHFQDFTLPIQQPMHDYYQLLIDELEKDSKTISDTIFEEYEGVGNLTEKNVKSLIALAIYRNNKKIEKIIETVLKDKTFISKVQ